MPELKNETEKDKNNIPNSNEILTFISAVIPNAQYFEARFDHLQSQIDEVRRNQDLRFQKSISGSSRLTKGLNRSISGLSRLIRNSIRLIRG